MGRGALCASVLVLGWVSGASLARAYTPTVTSGGVPVRWRGSPKINFAGNPANRTSIDAGSFYQSVVRSLQRWQSASGGAVGFDYWQGTDRSVYEANSDYNGLSSIYFASSASSSPSLSPNVLGLTQVWYNTDTGEILETDVVLNDRDFHFTTNPRDTSGYGSTTSGSYYGGHSNVYIENVLTHELGHAYGLSHSGGLQSTMLFMESPDQAHLGCDEEVGIHALYPSADAGARGGITGSVVSESGKALFGAHVVAISRRRGTVLATALTDRSGAYAINALEPGDYYLMVEPFFAGSSALPAYYSGASAAACPNGATFSRSVLMGSDGIRPQAVSVAAGGRSGAPALVARCSSQGAGGAALSSISGSSRSSSAPVIYDGARDGAGFGAADRFSYSNTTYYRLRSVSGRLEVHALSYSLYSPVQPTLTLLDSAGNPVYSARTQAPVYASRDSGFVNFDAALEAEGLPPGDYIVQVSASSMQASAYPAGPVSLDSVPFLILTGSVNEASPPLAAQLPDGARCEMSESFASYSSPGGSPPRRSTEDDSGGTGFCGTLSTPGGSSSGGGSGPTPGAMAGWLAPWLAMALVARLAKAMARAASVRRPGPLAT